ncbi:hypothetical protein CR513_21773, partial [Mucuna pruriens]
MLQYGVSSIEEVSSPSQTDSSSSPIQLRLSLVSLSKTKSESSQSETELAFYIPLPPRQKEHYQIGVIVGDTSSFVSLCAKFEFMMNPESNSNILHELDPEIDRTLRRLRKVRSTIVNNSSSSNYVSNSNNSVSTTNDSDFSEYSSSNVNSDGEQEPEPMENNDRMLKELTMLDVVYQPWCIQYPRLEQAQSYELKSGLIHLLPKFHGLADEDPHKHLKEISCGLFHDEAIEDIRGLH